MILIYIICLAAVSFQFFLGSVLWRLLREHASFEKDHPFNFEAPGISVVVPVKGPVAHLERAVSSLLNQDYPGPLEIIFAFQDGNDPSLPELEKVLAASRNSRLTTKILRGLPFLGLNPKNSNLVYGYREAIHPWIFFSDIDTRFETYHLRRCMALVRGDQNRYVTAVTVHEGARTLPALLEMISTNMSLFPYFIMTYRYDKKPGPINGAANLFPKALLEKAGGIEPILNSLTDDAVLERLLKGAGGRGALVPHFVRVTIEKQTWKGFTQRQFRWMLIAKSYFYPQCLVTPLLWVWQWLVLLGLIFSCPQIWGAGCLLLFCRVFSFSIFQTMLGVPARDRIKALALVFCDITLPLLWIINLPMRRVVWGGKTMIVHKGGGLVLDRSK